MIQQKVRLVKLETDDRNFKFNSEGARIGDEFWINCNSFAVRTFARKGEPTKTFQALMVKEERGQYIPAEVLEFTSDFLIKPE